MEDQYEVERAKFIAAKEKESELETLRGILVERVNELQALRVAIFKGATKSYDDMIDREAKIMDLTKEEDEAMEKLAEVSTALVGVRCAAGDALGKAAALKVR